VGNLFRDIHGRQFVFNGDNKQVEVRNSANQIVGEYKCDGNGKRTKKITANEYVVFRYDGLGNLIGEYSTIVEPAAIAKTSYLTTDHLGSPRVVTNRQGEVVSRQDFMPFGEEIAAMAETHRTPGDKYGVGDGARQKFTGYERDEETGLDFAPARYYNPVHGRFTAVDPLLASGRSANPQT
jgi:RHS repeat-associated protein